MFTRLDTAMSEDDRLMSMICRNEVVGWTRMLCGFHQRRYMAKSRLDYHRDSASFSNRCGIGAVRIPALAKSVTIHSRLNR